MTSQPLSVGIVGLGQIAQGYDSPAGDTVTTHIKACLADPRLRVAWIADADPARALDARARWNLNADIVTTNELLAKRPDILCIATPDETHASLLRSALKAAPRLILCEKPIAFSCQEGRALTDAAFAAKTAVAVNFLRRWLPGVSAGLSEARAGKWGAPVSARLTYCRGLRHNACHGFDLIGAALGGEGTVVNDVRVTARDFSDADPTVAASMIINSGGVNVPVAVEGAADAQFGVDIRFSAGQLRVWNEDGVRVRITAPNPSIFHDQPARHMALVWGNLADHLLSGAPLMCPAADTLDGMALVDAAAAGLRAFTPG